jgi:hypothetical protein
MIKTRKQKSGKIPYNTYRSDAVNTKLFKLDIVLIDYLLNCVISK